MIEYEKNNRIPSYIYVGLSDWEYKRELSDVFTCVEKITGIDKDILKSRSRIVNVTDARHLFCYFARIYTNLSLSLIGESINRNHSSVLHAFRKVDKMKDADKYYIRSVSQMKKLLKV